MASRFKIDRDLLVERFGNVWLARGEPFGTKVYYTSTEDGPVVTAIFRDGVNVDPDMELKLSEIVLNDLAEDIYIDVCDPFSGYHAWTYLYTTNKDHIWGENLLNAKDYIDG